MFGSEVEAIQWGVISLGSVTLRANDLLEDVWESVGDDGADGNNGCSGGEEDDDGEGVVFCDGECGEDGDIRCKRGDDRWAGKDSVDSEDTFSFISIRLEGLTSETIDNTSSLLE